MRRFSGIAATLFATVTGCGGPDELFIDAGTPLDTEPIDADTTEPDAEVPDADPSGSITVTTLAINDTGMVRGDPVAGVEVVAFQPDGTLADSGTTDSAGNVTLDGVLPGAAVSAVYTRSDDARRIMSVLAAEPGDHLTFGERLGPPSDHIGATSDSTLTFPAGGANNTKVFSPCASAHLAGTETSVVITQYDGCQDDPGDFLFVQVTNGAEHPVRSAALLDQPWGDATGVTLAAYGADITPSDVDLTGFTNTREADVQVSTVLDGKVTVYDYELDIPITTGVVDTTLNVVPGGEAVQSRIAMTGPGGTGEQLRYEIHPGSGTSLSEAITELPWVSGAIIGNQQAVWIQLGTAPYDGAHAQLTWQRYIPDMDGGEGTYVTDQWHLLMPPGTTTYAWDAVPAAIAPYVPTTAEYVYFDLQLVEMSSVAGYDELRQVPQNIRTFLEDAVAESLITGSAQISYDGGEGWGWGD